MTPTEPKDRRRRRPERGDSQRQFASGRGRRLDDRWALDEPCSANNTLLILFGTVTGTAETIAYRLADTFHRHGFAARVEDMARYKADLLARENCVLIVTSTYGNGEPPVDARGFWQEVVGGCHLDLRGLRFSVLALGNSTYDRFCQCGKDFDAALERLGATRLFPRVDCDMDFTEPVDLWLGGLLAALAQEYPASAAA